MNGIFQFVGNHIKTAKVLLIVLLLAISAALIFKPHWIVNALRYGVAVLNVVWAACLMVSAVRHNK